LSEYFRIKGSPLERATVEKKKGRFIVAVIQGAVWKKCVVSQGKERFAIANRQKISGGPLKKRELRSRSNPREGVRRTKKKKSCLVEGGDKARIQPRRFGRPGNTELELSRAPCTQPKPNKRLRNLRRLDLS